MSKADPFGVDVAECRSSCCSHRGSSKNARCRTSTPYRCSRGRRRRKPARAPRSAGAEGRRQLDPQGVGPRPERLDRGQEGAQRVVDVGEAALVGDRPRQLEYEPEVGGGLLGPRPHRVEGRRRVEGRVALHGVAPGRVGAEALARGSGCGSYGLPGRVRPHRAADVEFHGPEGTGAEPENQVPYGRVPVTVRHGRDVHEGFRAPVPDDGRPGARTGAGAPARPRLPRLPAPRRRAFPGRGRSAPHRWRLRPDRGQARATCSGRPTIGC